MKAVFLSQRIMASNSLIMGYASRLFNQTSGHFLKMTLLLMTLLFCGNVRAQETICASVDFSTKSVANSNYTNTWQYDGWSIYGAANNSNQWAYIRVGGKALTKRDRTITSNEPVACTIGKVLLTHEGVSSQNIIINYIKLIVASDASFTQIIDQKELNDLNITTSNGTVEISPSTSAWSANSYYKFIINVTNTSNKNGGLDLVKIDFYEAIAVTPTESYTVTFNAGTGTCETLSLTESNPGAGVTLPTATSPCPSDWIFAGWSTTEITAETTTAPQLYAEGSTYHPMANETLYAVYKKQDGEQGDEFALSISYKGITYYMGKRKDSKTFIEAVTSINDAAYFGLEATDGGYYVYYMDDSEKTYIGGNGNSTDLVFNAVPTTVWNVSENESAIVLGLGSRFLTLNTNTKDRFSTYVESYPHELTRNYESIIYYNTSPNCAITVSTPTFSPESGTYYETQNVAISCVTPNTYIYYTIDGTDPSESATATAVEYTGSPIVVDRSVTLKAVAVNDNLDFSDIATATYVIKPYAPSFTLESGTYYGSQSVDIICATEDVSIYYTTNGDEPSSSSTLYTGTLTIASTTTLKAVAIKNGESSEVSSVTYTIEMPQLQAPLATDATDITNTSFTANWEAVTNATSYVVNVWTENTQGFGVKNSSFEDGLQNWDVETGYSLSTEKAHSGNQSLAFIVTATKELRQTIENLTPREEITLSYWYYLNTNSSGNGLRFWCSWVGHENNSTLQPTTYSNKKGAWTQTTITTTVPEGATALNLEIRVYTGAKGYIDDIIVTQTNTTSNAPIPGSPFTVSSGTSLNVTGLSPDTKYCYNVVAKADGYLDSNVFNTICTTTSNTSCVLATPIVTATPTTSTIYLQWSPVEGATSYIVSLNAETPLTVTGTSYTFTSLTPSTNYNWSVAASSDECTGIAATGATETLEQPTVAGVEIVEVDTNGLKLDFHEQDAIATVVIDNEVTVSEGERPIADDIFFSKYFEASGNTKLLAIYNGTEESIALDNIYIKRGTDEVRLALGDYREFILPNQELIFYATKDDEEDDQKVIACAEEVVDDDWTKIPFTNSSLLFSGRQTITLYRGETPIDVIGAWEDNVPVVLPEDKEGFLGYKPSWGDNAGFNCEAGDNIQTEEIEDDYGLSTNRCLLIRRNHVKSGAQAVLLNRRDFNTLCTEWGGFHIDKGETQNELSCEGFGYVGGFDYQGYYTQYVQLQTTEFDQLTQNSDGTYTLPIPSLHKYSCTNIKLKTLDANGNVIETITYKVPIIVNQDVTTASEVFFHFEGDTCENCDVVIRDEATLTTEATGKTEFRNVEVYPQATLAVPENKSLTVNSLRMRSNAVEDQMPYANIVGTLNNQTNMLYYDMRINNSAYRFFALPDTIKVSSIKFSNGMPAVSGTDFQVMYYDGEQRTTNGGLQSNWKPLTADSSIWAGNGYNIATAKAKMQELRFELRYDKVMGPNTKQVHVFDYGMNDYRADKITPNNVGWNLVGNPYLYIYENGEGDGLVYGKLEIADDGYIWNDTENVRYITYFNDKGRTYLQDKVNRTLRPFKCFFVQVGDPENEEKGLMYVTFNKFKAHNPDRQMVLAQRTPEPSEEQYVAVQLALGDKTDKMGITIDNAYTTEYEIGRDLEKMMNYGTLPHVYAYVNNSQKLAFNAVPEWAAQSVVAGAYFPEAGEYTISLDPNDRPTNRVMAVWLTDMINNVTTNLLLGDYSFYAQRAEQKNRFMIAVELAPEISTSTLVSSADGVYAYIQQRQMTICGLAENSVVSVYDALGHLVIQRNTSDVSLAEQLPAAGMYLVKVVNAQQKATLKLLAY